MKWLLGFAIGCCSMEAQPGVSVTAPVLGTVFDARAGSVRSITGIPAAALIGSSAGGSALATAVSAGGQDYAIAVETETGKAVVAWASRRVELTAVRPGAKQIAVSPRGRSAAFYFPETGKVQIIGGLPGAPELVRELDVSGPVSSFAVSDDGELLLAAIDQGDGEALAIDQNGQGFRTIQVVSHVVAISFFPDSQNAMVAESANNKVSLTRGLQITPIADTSDGINDAVAVAASGDGSTVLVAMRNGQIAVRKLTTGEQTTVACSCEPSELAALRGASVFRLNAGNDGPIWILDASGTEPRVFFVARAEGSQQ